MHVGYHSLIRARIEHVDLAFYFVDTDRPTISVTAVLHSARGIYFQTHVLSSL